MTGQTVTETLEAEHRLIQKVVAGMALLAEALERGGEADVATLESVVEFLRTFADRCHHGKEEALLFPALERRGVPGQGCPLGGLTMEHQKGRAMVRELADAVRAYRERESTAKERLVASLRALAGFYPNHIWREDYLLFPLADKVLTPEDQSDLGEKFEAVEREVGVEAHERFERLAEQLEARFAMGQHPAWGGEA
jgi:hemerythrin-like domain-containing protein